MQKRDAMPDPSLGDFSHIGSTHRTGDGREPNKRRRRFFQAADKLRIVQESLQLSKRGDVAALLRRESIYSSHLAAWRKAFELHGAAGLEAAKPGRKPKVDWRDRRIRELEHRVEFLELELERVSRLAGAPDRGKSNSSSS